MTKIITSINLINKLEVQSSTFLKNKQKCVFFLSLMVVLFLLGYLRVLFVLVCFYIPRLSKLHAILIFLYRQLTNDKHGLSGHWNENEEESQVELNTTDTETVDDTYMVQWGVGVCVCVGGHQLNWHQLGN